MSIRVAHVNKEAGTYVGRPSRGRRGSALANPYVIGRDGDRGMVIAKYETWLANSLFRPEVAAAIDALVAEYRRRGSLVLTCWCAPEPCHGNVIARIVMERVEA